MSQYKTGTVSVNSGSNIWTGSGTAWLANASAGQSIVIPIDSGGDGKLYDIDSVDADGQITTTTNYGGDTVSAVAYAIHTGYTADNIPELARNDVATASLFTRAMRQIQTLFNQLTAKATGVATIAYTTDADRALTTTEARHRTLIVTESGVTLSATRQLSGFPEGEKTVINQTSDTIRCIVSTSAHVDVPPASGGETGKRVVYCDGTDLNLAYESMAAQDAGAVAITGGSATGLSTLSRAAGAGGNVSGWAMNTAASTSSYWAKLKTWTVATDATSAISETLQLESVGTSPGSSASITIHAECDATGNLSSANSAVSVNAIIGSVFAYNGFMLVQPSAGTVELYVQAQAASAVVGVYELAAENDAGVTAVAYNDGAAWQSATPSGTVAITSDWAGSGWIIPTVNSADGWVYRDGLGYRKDAMGRVWYEVRVSSGTDDTYAWVFPVGFRPSQGTTSAARISHKGVRTGEAVATHRIQSNGQAIVSNAGTVDYIWVVGSFLAEN